MYFLAETSGVITDALRSLMLGICELIYKLIIYFFNIFEIIGSAEILNDKTVQEIYSRIGLILGLFVIFRITISFIQYLIDPDIMLDKKNGVFNIVKRIFIVIILLGTTPSLFNLAFDLQDMIIKEGIIPKVITGKSSSGSGDFGGELAWFTFNSFYRVDDEFVNNPNACPDLKIDSAKGVSRMQNYLITEKSLRLAFNCVNNSEKVYYDNSSAEVYHINFDGHGLMAVIVGGFILWMLVVYNVQVGVRLIQLAYLQLIAPVPILLYLDPKGDDKLKKWFKQCTTTYLDFFIRTAVIYLVVFVIDLLIGNGKETFLNSIGVVDFWTETYITVIVILALLIFAKKVPDLFKELFPSAGGAAGLSLGLNPKKEVFEPLKSMYNNTPLGWAPKALGWAGKKAITAYDRKKYNLPKPRNKVQQYFDKLTPGHAEAVKQRNQALADARQWEQQGQRGKELFTSVDGELAYPDDHAKAGMVKEGFFDNQAYVESWNAKASAKSKVKSSEKLIKDINNYISDMQNNKDLTQAQKIANINMARTKLEIAEKNLSAAQGELKIAQERHEKNQKIYTKDAEKERLFNNYADTHKKSKTVNVEELPGFSQRTQSANNNSSNSTVSSTTQNNSGNGSGPVNLNNNSTSNPTSSLNNDYVNNLSSMSDKKLQAEQARLEQMDRTDAEDMKLKAIQDEIANRLR